MEATEVSPKLRDLGWYAWANDIDNGRATQSDLADALLGAIAEKEDWLKRHTFEPNTEGEAMHQRQAEWCEQASALIAAMQDEPPAPTQPRDQERDRG